MAALIAGFDAGQTHTTCRLAAANGGPPLAEGQGPGVRHLASSGGAAAFQRALEVSLAQALEHGSRGGQQPPRLLAAAVGASGIEAGSTVQAEALALACRSLELPPERTVVTGDERTALRGAMGAGSAGIVLISGTGTIAVGRNHQGHEHRCAGWGWLLDGAGSAMDIGRDGLSASLAMADGRRPESPLRARLWRALGVAPTAADAAAAIKALVVQGDFGPAGFARLAPLVAAAAAEGDRCAATIVASNAQALAAMAATIAARLGLAAPPVWGMGGALEHLQPLRQELARALATQLPGAQLSAPAGDACSGALALARACLEG